MTCPDSFERLWECQNVDFMRQPQGLPTGPQLCHHLLLHGPLPSLRPGHLLPQAEQSLQSSFKILQQRGRASFLSRKGWARPPTSAIDPRLSGVAFVSAGGLAPIMGTIWLHFPDCLASPVLFSLEAKESQVHPEITAQSMAPTEW